MIEVRNKQSCPVCGRACNIRREALNKELVTALFRVVKWAKEKNISKQVKRAEFSHLITGLESNTANFAKLAWFAPQFFYNSDIDGNKESSFYHFNFDAIDEFFGRKTTIATVVFVDPLYKANKTAHYTRAEERHINQIPALKEFLNSEMEYIVEYLVARNPRKYKETILQQTLPIEMI